MRNTAGLVALFLMWLCTVLVRFHVRVEPGEALWFMWVLSQGMAAASVGYLLRDRRPSDNRSRRRRR